MGSQTFDVVKRSNAIEALCSDGFDHPNAQPDGPAWRCILERHLQINPLGNVFDPRFRLLGSPLA
ncbi:MAG: hypothetical protein ACYC4N_16080 [Pirellulaceae bacterium]